MGFILYNTAKIFCRIHDFCPVYNISISHIDPCVSVLVIWSNTVACKSKLSVCADIDWSHGFSWRAHQMSLCEVVISETVCLNRWIYSIIGVRNLRSVRITIRNRFWFLTQTISQHGQCYFHPRTWLIDRTQDGRAESRVDMYLVQLDYYSIHQILREQWTTASTTSKRKKTHYNPIFRNLFLICKIEYSLKHINHTCVRKWLLYNKNLVLLKYLICFKICLDWQHQLNWGVCLEQVQ